MESIFIEQDCAIEHNGHKFINGGSFLLACSDGYRRGIVYVKEPSTDHHGGFFKDYRQNYRAGSGSVTTWHGEHIANAHFGIIYRGNFCRMRSVRFTLDGVTYSGRYCPDWSQMVRVKSTRKVQP